jgi:N-acetylornithine carbamoyltransferase
VSSGPRHLLSLRDLPAPRWERILALAETLSGRDGRRPWLRGKRLGMVFYNPSLRTRTAFEVACYDLGAHAVYLQVGGGLWVLEHRDGVRMDGEAAEHVKEGFGVLGRMLDGVGVRVFAALKDAGEDAKEPVLSAIARASSVPVWNLESATDHPHQGLADALTLRRRLGGEKSKVLVTWAPHVKPLPMAVPNAALLAFAREGHHVVLARPEGYDLSDGVLADARRLAQRAGGRLEITADRRAAFAGARAVYAKSWGSAAHYGDAKAAADGFAKNAAWTVDATAMSWTDRGLFMHCLPVRRNVVVADAVLDSPASVVLDQASARLDVQKASLVEGLEVDAPGDSA